MITKRSLLYIAVIQCVFSALDIFARSALKGHVSFWPAITEHWFPIWLLLQAAIAPFQIRLITRHGLGRGVALMNAFSVLYALVGGVLVLHEPATVPQCISAVLVVLAVWLMLTPKKMVHPVFIPSLVVTSGVSNHEKNHINFDQLCDDADELNQYSISDSAQYLRPHKRRRWRDR